MKFQVGFWLFWLFHISIRDGLKLQEIESFEDITKEVNELKNKETKTENEMNDAFKLLVIIGN